MIQYANRYALISWYLLVNKHLTLILTSFNNVHVAKSYKIVSNINHLKKPRPQESFLAILNIILILCRSSHPEVFCKKDALKISQNSQENICNFINLAQVFSCEFSEILKNTYFYKTPLVAASAYSGVLRYFSWHLNIELS